MRAVRVKPGRKYYVHGRDHVGGETVTGVPEKYLRVLTAAKGPLEYVPDSPAALTAVETREVKAEEPTAPLDEAPRPRRQYRRRDLTAED